jgi:hypothetical protein
MPFADKRWGAIRPTSCNIPSIYWAKPYLIILHNYGLAPSVEPDNKLNCGLRVSVEGKRSLFNPLQDL